MGQTAYAQFTNQGAGNNSMSSASSYQYESVFNTFDITYSPQKFNSVDENSSSSLDLNAVSLNWAQAKALTSSYPIYIQYGLGFQYAWSTESEKVSGASAKSTTSFLTAKIPLNLMYCFNIPSTNVLLLPHVGLNLQGHILGQQKVTAKYEDETHSEKMSFFNKDDMDDNTFSRFIVGWQIGAKVAFNKFVVGVAYEGPITNLYKDGDIKINTNQVNISLGIKF